MDVAAEAKEPEYELNIHLFDLEELQGDSMADKETPEPIRVTRNDSFALDQETYFTEEGYLVDEPVVTRIGVFPYKNKDGSTRRELRKPEYVFEPESLASYEGKPVIITHQAGRVDTSNVSDETVGVMLTEGYQDGDDVRVKVVIHNVDEVKQSGLRELSLGYDLVLLNEPGEWNGQPYDFVQTEIRINHLALVRDARAGDQARLNLDGTEQTLKGAESMTDEEKRKAAGGVKKTVVQRRHDEGTLEDPEAENKDAQLPPPADDPPPGNGQAGDQPANDFESIKSRRDARMQSGTTSALDGDVNALIDLLEEFQAQRDFDSSATPSATNEVGGSGEAVGGGTTLTIQMDSASVDAIVRERLKLGRIGDQLNLDGLEEMNPVAAKKAVIKKVNPNMRLDGKSEVYVNAAFDAAVAQIGANGGKDVNYQRRQMFNADAGGRNTTSEKPKSEEARERMEARFTNGGKE